MYIYTHKYNGVLPEQEGIQLGSLSGDARNFNNIETRIVIRFFFFPARQSAEENSRHSDRNISLFPS
jgi:hypothetical protein